MATGATLYRVSLALSDVDRGVYETLDLRPALHPSETLDHLAMRVLAHALYYEPGIAFSTGVSTGNEPPLQVVEPDGRVRVWIEVGTAPLDRLKRAARIAEKVVLLTARDPSALRAEARLAPPARSERVVIERIDPPILQALVRSLERRHPHWELTRSDDTLYVTTDDGTTSSAIAKLGLVDPG